MNSRRDELLDIVDAQDRVIGQMHRSSIYRKGLTIFRVVNLFLVNSLGQLWIPLRSETKRIFPSCLDVSMGGHVESGEEYADALKRELHEELNIDIDTMDCHLLGYLTPVKDNVSAFMKVYEIKTDRAPKYNKDDFSAASWLYPEEILDKIKNGTSAKEDLPILVRQFYKAVKK